MFGVSADRTYLPRLPGVARQRRATPLPRAAAAGIDQTRPWYADLHRTEAAKELTLTRPIPVALRLARHTLVPAATQCRRQLLLQLLFD